MSAKIEKKGCYGPHDNRVNLFTLQENETKKGLDECAQSVGLLIFKEGVKKEDDGTWSLTAPSLVERFLVLAKKGKGHVNPDLLNDPIPTLEEVRFPFDETDKFKEEPRPVHALGTAFLVGKKHLATAAHCISIVDSADLNEEWIKRLRVVFDFKMIDEKQCQTKFTTVRKVKKVVAWNYCRTQDWALLELKEEVEDRRLNLDPKCHEIKKGEKIHMLGHPDGLPLKYTFNANCKRHFLDEWIKTNLHAFSGNSGSPVFREDGNVIGILTAGWGEDYIKIDGTSHVNHLAESDAFAVVQRIKPIRLLMDLINTNDHEKLAQLIDSISYKKIEENGKITYVPPIISFAGVDVTPIVKTGKLIRDCSRESYRGASENSPDACIIL